MWHVSSRSGVAILQTAIHLLLRSSQQTWAVSPLKIGCYHPHPPSPLLLLLSWLVTYRDSIPARRRSPIQVLTGPDVRELRSCDELRKPLRHAANHSTVNIIVVIIIIINAPV